MSERHHMAEHAAAGDRVTLQRGRTLTFEGRTVRPGELFERDHPLVRANPGRFVAARLGVERPPAPAPGVDYPLPLETEDLE